MLKQWFFLTVVVCSSGVVGLAQINTGTISGSVSDATGAIVPGATVTVRNVETGIARTIITDAIGRYTAPQLGLGDYEVTAESAGFQTVVRSGITLTVGREAIVNFTLQVGAVAERIEVTGEAPLVETTTATSSGLVDEKTVRELPLNGRSFTDLMDLQPNVKRLSAVGATHPAYGFGVKFSVAGGHPDQNSYIVDGLNINDSQVHTPGSVAGGLLGSDTIREFRMLTSNYSAEFGVVTGGVMTAVTKTGTNTLHGSAFEFVRNSALDARNFFDNKIRPFKRNQFGFTLGGPIQRDRTFFFGSYEGLRQRLATTLFFRVPTEAARRGFVPSGPCASGCPVGPNAQKILNLYPLPNGKDYGDGTADFVSSPSNPTNENYFTVRGDHTLSEQYFLFGRYTFDDGDFANADPSGLFAQVQENRYQHLVLNLTSLWTPTLLNAFRAGVVRSVALTRDRPFARDVSPLVFIKGRGPGGVRIPGLDLTFSGTNPRLYWWTSYQYADDITYSRGNHSVKFGVSLQRNHDNHIGGGWFDGQWSFGSITDLFTERPRSLISAAQGVEPMRGWRTWIVGSYLQDDWKTLPNLTLNLGVRFEWWTVPTEVNNEIGKVPGMYTPPYPATVSTGSPYWKQRSAFAHASPRVGLAWDPFKDGKTSIRAGFGIFQRAIRNTDWSVSGEENPPFFSIVNLFSPPGPPLNFPDIFANFGPGLPPTPLRLDLMDFDMAQPYKLNWSFNVQREVLPNTLVNIGYVGSRGINLLGVLADGNSPAWTMGTNGRRYIPLGALRRNPNFTQSKLRTAENDSYYQSLQVSVQKHFSHGFQVNSSYTWSRSIDTNSMTLSQTVEFLGNSLQEAFPFDTKAHRGLSAYDLRHYWSTNYVLDLPFGPGKTVGGNVAGVAGKLLEGWSLSGVVTVNSGPPFSPALAFDYADALPQFGGGGQKPDLAPSGKLNPVLGGPDRYYDPLAFVLPPLIPECTAPGATCQRRVFGNVGRNTIIGPGLATWNFNLLKSTKVTEGSNVQFRAELFNLLNRPNFALPNINVFLAGQQRNAIAGRITRTATTSRQIQFALKFIF